MANPHKKDLLEAFRSAGAADPLKASESAGPFAPVEKSQVSREGGVAGPEPAERATVPAPGPAPQVARTAADFDTRSTPDPVAPLRPGQAVPTWLPWTVGVLVAFVVGLTLGRTLAPDTAAAAEPGEGGVAPAGAGTPFTAGAGRSPVATREPTRDVGARSIEEDASDAGVALYDAANQYTVVVATYGKSRTDFAWATHQHLADAGLPVFPPLERDRDILVVVGATPGAKDLAALEKEIRALAGWDGSQDGYADAYVQRIDRLIKR